MTDFENMKLGRQRATLRLDKAIEVATQFCTKIIKNKIVVCLQ